MNCALIFAGGAGHRMNTKTLPKQFLSLYGKPIIIYTLEKFDSHPEIDCIVIACLEGWEGYLESLIEKHGIKKVAAIVPGGDTGQQSIYNAARKLTELCPTDSIVLVHDGVRPLIDPETISANVACVKEHGSAVTVSPSTETVAITGSNDIISDIIDRSVCRLAKAPQSFRLGELLCAHEKARAEKLDDFIDSASLMRHYGHSLHTVLGSSSNIKITTPSDFYIFRALVDAMETEQIIGL